jgi:hypothetical protein
MTMITGIRPPLPRHAATTPAWTHPPVVAQNQIPAVAGVPPRPSTGDPQVLSTRTSAETSATMAAEAAREAYIKASLAAGISPLPLAGA